jgi:coenzyme F420 hydrogenase subunit beta
MSQETRTVRRVVEEKLCTSCGACYAVCPSKAISFKETIGGHMFPVIDESICNSCGLCYSVCPGIHFDKTLMRHMPVDPFRGTAMDAFVGKARDKEIYNNSQSGGIASALALYMLESRQADAVMTVVMEWGNPPRAKAHLARNREDIIMAQKSKYCPVPILTLLREAVEKDYKKIVLIGTSCQIHGLMNIRDIVPKLGNRVVLTIGLFCTHVMTCAAIDHLISETKLGNHMGDKHLDFKDKSCGGYPGNVHIRSSNGISQVLPKERRGRIKKQYIPARCWLCFDGLNVFSDIAVGDPWHLEGVDRKNGESVVVARTKKGQKIIQQATEKNAISLKTVSYDDVVDGQSAEKFRVQWRGYIEAWKQMGRNPPDYYSRILQNAVKKPGISSYAQKLKFILSIDNHETREKVLCSVETETRRLNTLYNRMLRYGSKKINEIINKLKYKA